MAVTLTSQLSKTHHEGPPTLALLPFLHPQVMDINRNSGASSNSYPSKSVSMEYCPQLQHVSAKIQHVTKCLLVPQFTPPNHEINFKPSLRNLIFQSTNFCRDPHYNIFLKYFIKHLLSPTRAPAFKVIFLQLYYISIRCKFIDM